MANFMYHKEIVEAISNLDTDMVHDCMTMAIISTTNTNLISKTTMVNEKLVKAPAKII